MRDELYHRIAAVLIPLLADFDNRQMGDESDESEAEWNAIIDRVVAELSVSLDDVLDVAEEYGEELRRRAEASASEVGSKA
jgi:hypothetical protein